MAKILEKFGENGILILAEVLENLGKIAFLAMVLENLGKIIFLAKVLESLGGNGKWHFNFSQGLGVGMFGENGVFENFMIDNLQEEEGRNLIFFFFFNSQ